MSGHQLLVDVAETVGRMLGRGGSGDEFDGRVPSAKFLAALRDQQADKHFSALESLEKRHYGLSWKFPGMRASVIQEMRRGSRRSLFGSRSLGKVTPRGFLTGYTHYGVGRAFSNFHPSMLKWAGGLGLASMAFEAATAKKGNVGKEVIKSAGATAGGIVGAAAGAFMLGLPGEWVGGFVGGEIGGTIGRAVTTMQDIGRQGYHANLGGHYEDSEPAWTLRQRAVREMGSSALNARQYLGREAALFHES